MCSGVGPDPLTHFPCIDVRLSAMSSSQIKITFLILHLHTPPVAPYFTAVITSNRGICKAQNAATHQRTLINAPSSPLDKSIYFCSADAGKHDEGERNTDVFGLSRGQLVLMAAWRLCCTNKLLFCFSRWQKSNILLLLFLLPLFYSIWKRLKGFHQKFTSCLLDIE